MQFRMRSGVLQIFSNERFDSDECHGFDVLIFGGDCVTPAGATVSHSVTSPEFLVSQPCGSGTMASGEIRSERKNLVRLQL